MPGITGDVVIVPLGLTVAPPPIWDGPVLPLTPTGSAAAGAVAISVALATV